LVVKTVAVQTQKKFERPSFSQNWGWRYKRLVCCWFR